jgi:hypothetical protein
MRSRCLATVRSLIARVRIAPSAEPVSRPPIPREPPADLPVRPRLADHASRFVQLERDVWDQFRPQVREAVQAALDAVAGAEATRARPVCCGQAMPRHDRRPVQWLTWVGVVRAPVTRYRCAGCRAERRPLLETLEVEPGQPSGCLAQQLGLLGCVASYPLAAQLAGPLFGLTANTMTIWRAVQRLGEAAAQPPPLLPPVTEGHFREVKTGVLLRPAERVEGPPGRHTVVAIDLSAYTNAAILDFSRRGKPTDKPSRIR